jgi:hypothetical protein
VAMQLRQLLQVIIKAGDVLAPTIPGAAEEARLTLIEGATARLSTDWIGSSSSCGSQLRCDRDPRVPSPQTVSRPAGPYGPRH